MSETLFRDKRLPVIQRTKDGLYFHVNEDCYKRIEGVANKITPGQFRAATKGEKLETFDMEMSK